MLVAGVVVVGVVIAVAALVVVVALTDRVGAVVVAVVCVLARCAAGGTVAVPAGFATGVGGVLQIARAALLRAYRTEVICIVPRIVLRCNSVFGMSSAEVLLVIAGCLLCIADQPG